MDLLANRDRSIPLESACEMLGILRSTVQRLLAPHVRGPRKLRPSSPRKLSEAEAQMVFDTLYSARIRDGLRTRSTRSSWTRAQKSARPARRTAAWGLTATRLIAATSAQHANAAVTASLIPPAVSAPGARTALDNNFTLYAHG
jgi:hypothetical protein